MSERNSPYKTINKTIPIPKTVAPREVTDAQRAKLHQDFADVFTDAEVDQHLEECLAYPFKSTKGRDWYLTARGWIRKEATLARSRQGRTNGVTSTYHPAAATPRPSSKPGSADAIRASFIARGLAT